MDLIRCGTMRFSKRPYPDDERLLIVGDHWETGAEVVLRVFDADESDYYAPGPVEASGDFSEREIAEGCGIALFDSNEINVIGFTVSPEAYDYSCTVELEQFNCSMFPGESERTYRKVLIRGGFGGLSNSQAIRYMGFSEEDPRAIRANFDARIAQEKAEREVVANRLAADEAYLASLTVKQLHEEETRREDYDGRTITYDDLKRCRAALVAREQQDRDTAWSALLARIPIGATLLIPETPREERTDELLIRQLGRWIPGTPAYLVSVIDVPWCPKETPINQRTVTVQPDRGNPGPMNAEHVAELCEKHLATGWPEVKARQKLIGRLSSYESLYHAFRYEDGGVSYWVGTARFSSEIMVLDGEAKIVRRKKLVEAAMAAFRTKRGY